MIFRILPEGGDRRLCSITANATFLQMAESKSIPSDDEDAREKHLFPV